MITSTKNPRIVEVRKLAQRKHRLRQNSFLVEGLQILSIAVEAMDSAMAGRQVIPREVFYSEASFSGETAPRLLTRLTQAGAKITAVAPNVLNSLSERDAPQGLAVTFALQELELPFSDLEVVAQGLTLPKSGSQPSRLVLILDQLQDPGNLGTLIRTADSVGACAVILLEPCVDPFDPKTIRSTMGSIFTVPFMRIRNQNQNLRDCLTRLSNIGYYLVGADARQGQPVWQGDTLRGSVALALGNEARGLSSDLQHHLAHHVSLPLLGQAESLNVAVAGGILMYEWLRLNQYR